MSFFSRLFRKPVEPPPRPSASAAFQTESWPFDQAPETLAVTSRQVLEGAPVLAVVHYSNDHAWAFLCGTTDEPADGRVISMREAVERDATLTSIADLPPGWKAWRDRPGADWNREANAEQG